MISEQPKTEAEWQAEDDARTLAQAEVIKQDKARLEKAQSAAEKIAAEERERAKAMAKVAGKKSSKPSEGIKQKSGTVGTFNTFKRI